MAETPQQTKARLEKELPKRQKEAKQLKARLNAVRRRIAKVKQGIAARSRAVRLTAPKVHLRANVRNQSVRTEPIKLIVLHDTEGGNVKGTADLAGVNSWFNNPASLASAHITVDAEGHTARHVQDGRKAWHCSAYNSKSLGIEQIGFMTQREWPEAQIDVVARWVAYWAKKYNIPLKHSTSHGVCQHKDLGVAGGNHGDCGDHYPFDKVLAKARALTK